MLAERGPVFRRIGGGGVHGLEMQGGLVMERESRWAGGGVHGLGWRSVEACWRLE
jgi:hypothetical protein